MSEQSATTEPVENAETPSAEPQGNAPENSGDTTDWKAEARKWESRAKENSAAAAQLKELQDKDKTDAERIAELERENAAHRLEKQRAEWARDITKGSRVPAAALRGDSEQAMREHFEELKALIPDNPNPQTVIPGDAERQQLALNGSGIEDALRDALGIQ